MAFTRRRFYLFIINGDAYAWGVLYVFGIREAIEVLDIDIKIAKF